VDAQGAPLTVYVSGANQHDKWVLTELISGVLTTQSKRHFCRHRGLGHTAPVRDTMPTVASTRLPLTFMKSWLRRGTSPISSTVSVGGEPVLEVCTAAAGEKAYPAHRWVVERTMAGFAKGGEFASELAQEAELAGTSTFACSSWLNMALSGF